MELAIKKAKEVGVAWVTCTGEISTVLGIVWQDIVSHAPPLDFFPIFSKGQGMQN